MPFRKNETEKQKKDRNERNRLQGQKRRAKLTAEEKQIYKKRDADAHKLKRMEQRNNISISNFMKNFVNEASNVAVYQVIRKENLAKYQGKLRVERKKAQR